MPTNSSSARKIHASICSYESIYPFMWLMNKFKPFACILNPHTSLTTTKTSLTTRSSSAQNKDLIIPAFYT